VCQPRVWSPSGEHAAGVGEAAAGGRPAGHHELAGTAAVVSVSPVEKGAAAAAACAGTPVPARRTSTEVPGQVSGRDPASSTDTTPPGQQRGTKAPGLHHPERTGPRPRTTGTNLRGIRDRRPARGAAKRYLQETTKKVAGPPGQWETGRVGQVPEGWWC
jgi:hypothetical protein